MIPAHKKTHRFQAGLMGLLFLLLATFHSKGQESQVFTFEAFYDLVLKNHPYSRQALLLPEMAKAELRSARGAFDPVISTQMLSKKTNGVNSYTYFEPQLKIPTLPGIDIKAGMDQSSGISVSPEVGKFDPLTGGTKNVTYQLFYAGVSVPLLRGLVTDVRRNQLQQAKLLKEMNEAEWIGQTNKLLLSAAKTYWDWQQSYQKLIFAKENLELALNRKNYIFQRILAGEEKPIDSVEAKVELRRREAITIEIELEFINAGIELSNYLWDENLNPLQTGSNLIPAKLGSEKVIINSDSLVALISFAADLHPDVIKFKVKLKQTELERKLAIENIKPQMNLEYYPFQTFTNQKQDVVDGLFMKNYKLGFSFYSSIFLRKERGKLQLTNYKVKQAAFMLSQGKRESGNQVKEFYNEMNAIRNLLDIQNELVENAVLLRNAEDSRFENGESSLFLVNQRERGLLEAQIKQAELNAKYAKAKVQLQWATGKRLS